MHLTSFEISCFLKFFNFFQQPVLTLNYTSLIIGNYVCEDCIESQWYLNSKEMNFQTMLNDVFDYGVLGSNVICVSKTCFQNFVQS